MKYFVRAVKYLIYFVILFFVIVLMISLLTHQDISDFQSMFVEGALAKISIIFIIIAAVYPAFGFKLNHLFIEDDWSMYHDTVVETMQHLGYRLASEDPACMVFRSEKGSIRFSRMWEDAITFTITDDPKKIDVDGPFKDTIRATGAIRYNYRMNSRVGDGGAEG